MRVFLFLLISLLSSTAFAQNSSHRYKIGLSLGLQSAYLDNNYPDPVTYDHSSISIIPGFIFDYQLTNRLFLRSGLHIAKQGGESRKSPITDYEHPEGTGKYLVSTITMRYLELPIEMYYEYRLKPLSMFAGSGFTGGCLISANRGTKSNDARLPNDKSNIRSNMSNYNMSLNFFAGARIPVTSEAAIEIGCKYTHGLTDISKEHVVRQNEMVGAYARSRSLEFYSAFMFGF